jgi:hypothetical protein
MFLVHTSEPSQQQNIVSQSWSSVLTQSGLVSGYYHSSEALVTTKKTAGCCNSEDHNLYIHHCENFKSLNVVLSSKESAMQE